MTSSGKSLADVLEYWAQAQPDKTYLFAPETGATLSYGQLALESRYLSSWLDQKWFTDVKLS